MKKRKGLLLLLSSLMFVSCGMTYEKFEDELEENTFFNASTRSSNLKKEYEGCIGEVRYRHEISDSADSRANKIFNGTYNIKCVVDDSACNWKTVDKTNYEVDGFLNYDVLLLIDNKYIDNGYYKVAYSISMSEYIFNAKANTGLEECEYRFSKEICSSTYYSYFYREIQQLSGSIRHYKRKVELSVKYTKNKE